MFGFVHVAFSALTILCIYQCLRLFKDFIVYGNIYRVNNINRWWYTVVSCDLGSSKSKPMTMKHKGVMIVGQPDIVFRHRIFPAYLTVEIKSRQYKGAIKAEEYFQLSLYGLLLKKNHFIFSNKLILQFRDESVVVATSPKVNTCLLDYALILDKLKESGYRSAKPPKALDLMPCTPLRVS